MASTNINIRMDSDLKAFEAFCAEYGNDNDSQHLIFLRRRRSVSIAFLLKSAEKYRTL